MIQIAFVMPHCTRLKSALPSTKISSSDMMDEVIDANRLARSHPMIGPPGVRRDRGRSRGADFPELMSATSCHRSTSAMRALYQFMNRLMPRLMVRNTSMMSAIASIAWPVWFSVVFAIDTMSW